MKKTMFALSAISLATSLSLMSSSALAYSSASASLTNLAYTLTDLTPKDGYADYYYDGTGFDLSYHYNDISFSYITGDVYERAIGNGPNFNYITGRYIYEPDNTPLPVLPLKGLASIGKTYASATLGRDGLSTQGYAEGLNTFSAEGYAEGHDSSKYLVFNAEASPALLDFILGPQTTVTFTGNLSLAAASSANSSFGEEFSSASGGIHGYTYNYSSPYFYDQSFGVYQSLVSKNGHQTLVEARFLTDPLEPEFIYSEFTGNSFSSAFSTSFTNNSDYALAGILYYGASVNGTSYSSVSPVPEPSTYAMLLAGLCLITFASRRNKNT